MVKRTLFFWFMLLLGVSLSHAATTDNGVRVPFKQAVGMGKFKQNCSQCHGEWARGTEQGPPLIHNYYKPSHHGNDAFYRAAMSGVKAHHWKFGDMPPVQGIKRRDVARIISFVRWLQQANNLY